jgi:DNA-binding SARP family transcriptional activator
MSGRTQIQLCGRLVVEVDGRRVESDLPARKGRLLLAYLALNRARPVRRDELIAAVWLERPPADPDAALKTLLSRTRRALGPGVLQGRSELSLELGDGQAVDVEVAAQALASGRGAADDGDWKVAWAQARVALGIARRGLLPGLEAPWIDQHRREIEELELDALELVAETALALGGAELSGAERATRSLLERAPFRESSYAVRMRLLAQRGNVAQALQVYEDLRRLLRDELGTAPSAPLVALHERLLRGEGGAPAPRTSPARPEATARLPLPPPVAAAAQVPVVGRDPELERAEALLASARGGSAHELLLVAGEPGIGKTLLAAQLATRAHAAGATVLYGRCDEEALVPYQPWVEALGHYISGLPEPELRRRIGTRGPDLARMLPTLRQRLPDLEPSGPGDPETERYLMFEAVAGLLAAAARPAGGVLVLDDLHWADRPTLVALRHLLRGSQTAPLLVLGTYRGPDAGHGMTLAEELAELRRERPIQRIELRGLGEDEIAALVRARTGRAPFDGLARTLHERTDGNPFFAVELIDHLSEGGRLTPEAGVPAGVKDVIGRRLARLGEPSREVLALASVIGRSFDPELVQAIAERDPGEVEDTLDEAVAAGILLADPTSVGALSFSHALVRDALYDGIRQTRRARMHRDIGRRLEELAGPERGVHLAELARHFGQVARAGEAERALKYAALAGDQAMAMLAYEDAVEHYGAALRALGPGNERERCRLLLKLGAAQRESTTVTDARQTFASAAELARGRWPQLLAAAALGYVGAGLGGVWWYAYGQADRTLIDLLREALTALGRDAPALRAQVLARLATELYFSPTREEAEALSREAVEIARGLSDDQTLIRALTALHTALWVPSGLGERARVADELVVLAERLGHPELEMSGRAWRLTDSLELGDVDAVDAEIDACARIAEDRPHPVHAWYATLFRASRALVDGRFDDAERLAAAAHAAGAIEPVQNTDQAFALQTFALRCEQGRLPELLEAVDAMVKAHPAVVAWRCAHAYVLAETGEDAAARAALDQVAVDRFRAIPADSSWLSSRSHSRWPSRCVRDRGRRERNARSPTPCGTPFPRTPLCLHERRTRRGASSGWRPSPPAPPLCSRGTTHLFETSPQRRHCTLAPCIAAQHHREGGPP